MEELTTDMDEGPHRTGAGPPIGESTSTSSDRVESGIDRYLGEGEL